MPSTCLNAARLSFVFTFFVELPSTFSSFCLMEVVACWVRLFTMNLVFSEPTSIPYAAAVVSRLVVRTWSSASLPPMRSMSSAKRRLHSGRPPMEMEVWRLWRISCMTFFKYNMLNKMPYTIECFFEVDEVIVEYTLVLQVFRYQQSYIEGFNTY